MTALDFSEALGLDCKPKPFLPCQKWHLSILRQAPPQHLLVPIGILRKQSKELPNAVRIKKQNLGLNA